MHGYIAFYAGRRIELHAASLYAAKCEALRQLKPPKSKEHMVSVLLAQKADGAHVVHVADF